MRKYIIIIVILVLGVKIAAGQSLFEPNYALKSPQTLEIIKIDIKDDVSLLTVSIENMVDGGHFCIDPATYIYTDDGEKYQLAELTGLPLCPDSYKFTRVGEIKYVTLQFPAIKKETRWLDIIEECGDNCLSVYGLSLDPSLNSEINICFRDIERGRYEEAIKGFEVIKAKLADSGNPILGSIYLNLISLYENSGNTKKAEELKSNFKGVLIPHKELFLQELK